MSAERILKIGRNAAIAGLVGYGAVEAVKIGVQHNRQSETAAIALEREGAVDPSFEDRKRANIILNFKGEEYKKTHPNEVREAKGIMGQVRVFDKEVSDRVAETNRTSKTGK